MVFTALAVRLATGAAPAYSADSIVSGADSAPGPFALNSIITVYGANLAYQTAALPANAKSLPFELASVSVSINNYWVPLIYVSPTQINLLVPGNLNPGTATLYVERQGQRGPDAMITLISVAPQLFTTSAGNAIAQHADYSMITPSSAASPGETIILYATGLGITAIASLPAEIPQVPTQVLNAMQVLLNGTAVSADLIKYAGITPGTAGVYQVNLQLPNNLPANPQIALSSGGQTSSLGVILLTQPSTN